MSASFDSSLTLNQSCPLLKTQEFMLKELFTGAELPNVLSALPLHSNWDMPQSLEPIVDLGLGQIRQL